MTADEVLDAALALPEADRLEIAEALLASARPADKPPLDEAWREAIRRRSDELRSGRVVGVPWEWVRQSGREA